jgi:tRNA threonylcarbamoyladenosine biosynthesis protein TsaB
MNILAFDCAGAACSVAVAKDGTIAALLREAMERGQAERLMPMIVAAIEEAGLSFAALDLLAATTGPGSFTGLRVGLAALRGLALASAKPMLGISSLEAVARGTHAEERAGRVLVVLLESKRADLYAQLFEGGLAPAGEPFSAEPRALATKLAGRKLLLAGDGARRAEAALAEAACDLRFSQAPGLPDAALLAALAAERAGAASLRPPAPLYLRRPDVTMPASAPPNDAAQRA